MAFQWDIVTAVGEWSYAISDDSIYYGDHLVWQLDLTDASPSPVNLNMPNAILSYDNASTTLIWFKSSLYAYQVAGGSRGHIEVYRYNGTPGNWTQVVDGATDFGVDANNAIEAGFYTDDDYLYAFDGSGHVLYSQNGTSWTLFTIADAPSIFVGGLINLDENTLKRGWRHPGTGRGIAQTIYPDSSSGGGPFVFHSYTLQGGTLTKVYDSILSYPGPSWWILGLDYNKIWRSLNQYTFDTTITPTTTWTANPTPAIVPSPTHNLPGITIGVNSFGDAGFVHLWNNSTNQWETSNIGNITDFTTGAETPVVTFILAANNETYMMARNAFGTYYILKKTATLATGTNTSDSQIAYLAGQALPPETNTRLYWGINQIQESKPIVVDI
jgi:hypothetical protein